MFIRLATIQELKIFDVAMLKGRSNRTLFSAIVDGKVIYSKALIGVHKLHSGTDTVGAFKDDTEESMFAWIDPVSGEYLLTTDDGTFRPSMLMPAFVLFLITVVAMFLENRTGLVEGFLAIPILLGALAAIALKKLADRKLELALRAKLRESK